MSTSSEHLHEELFELEPAVKVARARAGVILLILSDALSVLAIIAAGGYLNALNTTNQFRINGEHAPAVVPGIVLAVILVLSGVVYYLWERGERANAGAGSRLFLILAWVLMLVALVVQVWICFTLGYASPFHAYESVIILVSWFSAVHFLLAAVLGILLIGRSLRSRLAEHPYITEVSGYWWYYTVVAAILLWAFSFMIA